MSKVEPDKVGIWVGLRTKEMASPAGGAAAVVTETGVPVVEVDAVADVADAEVAAAEVAAADVADATVAAPPEVPVIIASQQEV